MGFWDSVKRAYEGFVEVAASVGKSIVRATKATVDFVYDIAMQIGGKIAEASRKAFVSLGEDIKTVIDVSTGIVIKIIDAAGNIIEKIVTKTFDVWKVIKDSYQKNIKGGTMRAEFDNASLNNLFIFARGLLHLAESIKHNPEMQKFEEFARLRVSTRFLEDLLDHQENITSAESVNVRFMGFVNKFLTNSFENDGEIKEFDDLIFKMYKKSLLIIGSETLVEFWERQRDEFLFRIGQISTSINELTIQISKLEKQQKNNLADGTYASQEIAAKKQEIVAMQKESEQALAEFTVNRDMAGISRGLLFVMQWEGQVKSSLMTKGQKAGELLIRWKNGSPPSDEQLKEIRAFNLLADEERKRAGSTSGETTV